MSASNGTSKTRFVGKTVRLANDCFSFRRRLAVTLSVAVLLGTVPLCGQTAANSEEPISTDRPAVANSSVVVPQGGLQFENGLLITNTQGQHVLDLPETSIRFGLLSKTELRLEIPDYFHDLPAGTTTTSAFGDVALGFKQQFGPIHKNFDLSAIVFLSFPSGANGVSSHGYDPGLQFPWSYKLTGNWTVGGQVASYWPTLAGKHTFTGESTFLLDRQLTKRWDAFVEYAGDFPQRGGPRHLLHFGSAYKLGLRNQIDFHVCGGFSRAAPDSFVGVGYSFLFRAAR
jgi:hypothetical protein